MILNFIHWIDVVVLKNGDKYRTWFLKQGFIDADEWTDVEVLSYLKH